MPNDPRQDHDFQMATPQEQHAYLMATDPDYAKASPSDKVAYLQYVSGKLGETQFERDSQVPGRLEAGEEVAGKLLRGAGLPESIPDIPDWAARMTGQDDNPIPFWKPISDAITNPTQRNVVGAVPFAGPTAVAMADEPTVLGKLATGVGAATSVEGAKRVAPGLRSLKKDVAESTRTPANKLTPGTKALATTTGGAVGGAVGHSVHPGLGWPGAVAGARMGATVADWVLPERMVQPPMPDIPMGTPTPFPEATSSATPVANPPVPPVPQGSATPFPLRSGPPPVTPPSPFGDAASSMNPQANPPLPAVSPAGPAPTPAPIVTPRAAPRVPAPASTGVTRVPVPREPLPGENPNNMASVPRSDLAGMAKAGRPGAAAQMRNIGEDIIYTPETGYAPPKSVTTFPETLPHPDTTQGGASVPTATTPPPTDLTVAPKVEPTATVLPETIQPDFVDKSVHPWESEARVQNKVTDIQNGEEATIVARSNPDGTLSPVKGHNTPVAAARTNTPVNVVDAGDMTDGEKAATTAQSHFFPQDDRAVPASLAKDAASERASLPDEIKNAPALPAKEGMQPNIIQRGNAAIKTGLGGEWGLPEQLPGEEYQPTSPDELADITSQTGLPLGATDTITSRIGGRSDLPRVIDRTTRKPK